MANRESPVRLAATRTALIILRHDVDKDDNCGYVAMLYFDVGYVCCLMVLKVIHVHCVY